MEKDDRIIKKPNSGFKADPRGLGYVFYQKMVQHQNNIAQINGITGETETYGVLLERCKRVAVKLRSKGITPDDIVISCTYNHKNSCVPLIATAFLGSKISALDPTLSLSDIVHLLGQVTPKVMFVMQDSVELIEEALAQIETNTEIVVFGETTKHTSFSDFLQPSSEADDFKPYEMPNCEETALILFSSGTSGLPKGICLNHSHFIKVIEEMNYIGYDFSISLVTTSLYWITANIFLAMSIFEGQSRIVVPKFELPLVLTAINNYKPTVIFTTPIQLLEIYTNGIPEEISVDSIKEVLTGGVTILPKQIDYIRSVFPKANVLPCYGQTEVIMITMFKPEEEHLVLTNGRVASGRPFPGLTFKIVDIETEETLGPNQQGELRLKVEHKLNGYYKRDFSEVWDSNGWYKTGDIVYYDENNCFYVVDRIKEMLKFRTWHVAPAAIENVLLTHPAVEKCLVIGIPHEIDGDHPMAIVVLRKSHKNTTSEEIKEFVNARVDDRKKLRGGVKIVESFLVQPTGKIKRRLIRNMVLNGEM